MERTPGTCPTCGEAVIALHTHDGAPILTQATLTVAYCPPPMHSSPLPGQDHADPDAWEVRRTYPLHIPLCAGLKGRPTRH